MELIFYWVISFILLYIGNYYIAKEMSDMINYEEENTHGLASAMLLQFMTRCVFIIVLLLTIVEKAKDKLGG